jgi:urease accessory protein
MADNAAMTSRLPDSAALPASCWQAELRLEFGLCGARTVLEGNRHRGPLRVQKALYPEGEGVCQAIVLHPPSGIAGGDRLSLTAHLGPGAHAQLTTPGAGKWYRSAGLEASQTLDFTLAAGAALEWLPQETIVFDGARARMGATVALAADAVRAVLRIPPWDAHRRIYEACTRDEGDDGDDHAAALWVIEGHVRASAPRAD